MYLRRLVLANFRIFRELDLTLPPSLVVVTGQNGQGKTTLLEAIFLLATTRSPFTTLNREWLGWEAADDVLPFCRVQGEVATAAAHATLELILARQSADPTDERVTKRLRVNGSPRRAMDVLGILNAVLFMPRDIAVVAEGPSERRLYLDVLLCQIDKAYCMALSRYNRVLEQRNHLLKRLRDHHGKPDELAFWDERLVTDGAHLVQRRLAVVDELARLAADLHSELAGGGPVLGLTYRSGVLGNATSRNERPRVFRVAEPAASYVAGGDREGDSDTRIGPSAGAAAAQGPDEPHDDRPIHSPNGSTATSLDGASRPDPSHADATIPDPGTARLSIAAAFYGALQSRRTEEIARGVTLVGPHRDDISFALDTVDLRTYGSRGQQRTAVLALKLAEARLMWHTTGERPVLLFDDVLGELDAARSSQLLAHIDQHQQTLITTTEAERLPPEILARALVLEVDAGRIVKAWQGGRAVTPPVG